MNSGWQCPNCGRCYAPWMARCTECKPKPISSTGTSAATTPSLDRGRCHQQDHHDAHEFRRWGTPFWCDGRGDIALVAQGRCPVRYAAHDKDERCVLYATHVIEGLPHRFIFESAS